MKSLLEVLFVFHFPQYLQRKIQLQNIVGIQVDVFRQL